MNEGLATYLLEADGLSMSQCFHGVHLHRGGEFFCPCHHGSILCLPLTDHGPFRPSRMIPSIATIAVTALHGGRMKKHRRRKDEEGGGCHRRQQKVARVREEEGGGGLRSPEERKKREEEKGGKGAFLWGWNSKGPRVCYRDNLRVAFTLERFAK
ncbi:hypothetical protein Taro_022628 [Colocasia esculenta]|uniref:Uncharacterized protein n=1 Tax=Colocasia esculenta TaxID=4460 RepID=A0A843UUY6_COLES|nr:hypothetical protein [Colocasia esculenta]